MNPCRSNGVQSAILGSPCTKKDTCVAAIIPSLEKFRKNHSEILKFMVECK